MAEVTPEQAAQVLQQVTAPPQQATTPSPIRIETATGAVFEGATEQEVLQKLVHSVESGSTHIRTLNERIDALQSQVQQHQQPQTPQQESVQDRYWKIWQTDPIAADRFAAAQRLGIPEQMVDQVERNTLMQTANMAKNNAVQDFLARCPDYPDDQQTAYLMNQEVAQIRARWGNPPVDAGIMELAFHELVRKGQVLPVDVQLEGIEDTTTMPRVGSGSQLPPVDFERQFRQLTPDKQKQVIDQLAAQGHR